jgi:hypothetical protein
MDGGKTGDGRAHTTTTNRRSAVDRRTTRHRSYTVSQRIRKQADRGGLRLDQDRRWPAEDQVRAVDRVGSAFRFAAAYNLVRLPRLLAEAV